jgi:hypothetical protein
MRTTIIAILAITIASCGKVKCHNGKSDHKWGKWKEDESRSSASGRSVMTRNCTECGWQEECGAD